jgi:hypothetical protein
VLERPADTHCAAHEPLVHALTSRLQFGP